MIVDLHEWMEEKAASLSKKSWLVEALAYVLNQWDARSYYCDDGLVDPNHNAAEWALRTVPFLR